MGIDERLLEIRQYAGYGYSPVIVFQTWRAAVLNFGEDTRPQSIRMMQRHDDTDEVFVLLRGKCLLIIGEGEAAAERLHFEEMEPLKFYNVKRGAWHNHVLSDDASVLIVENQDTSDFNSPKVSLSKAQQAEIVQAAGVRGYGKG